MAIKVYYGQHYLTGEWYCLCECPYVQRWADTKESAIEKVNNYLLKHHNLTIVDIKPFLAPTMKTNKQHHKEVKILAENAARKAQVKALRKQRKKLLDACKKFVFLEKTKISKKQVLLCIENTKDVIKEVEEDF